MIGALAKYAASRAVGGVADNVVRRATWFGVAAVLGIIGVVMLVLVAFWWLQRTYDPETVGVLVAVACFVLAGLAVSVPAMIEWMKRPAAEPQDPLTEAANAVVEEAHDAVDYLGPARLVGSAFMVGLGVGRRISR